MINTWNTSIHRIRLDLLFIMRHSGVYFLCHPTSTFLTYERGEDKPVEVHFFPPHSLLPPSLSMHRDTRTRMQVGPDPSDTQTAAPFGYNAAWVWHLCVYTTHHHNLHVNDLIIRRTEILHLDSQVSFLTSDSNLLQAQGKTEGDRSQPATHTDIGISTPQSKERD